mgnify:CR=1 FL=1
MNKGHVSLLVLLSLSAKFDTIDYNILMYRLNIKIGLKANYSLLVLLLTITSRRQQISVNGTLSDFFELKCRVPQGYALAPFFIEFMLASYSML